jgi:hypothetical protein
MSTLRVHNLALCIGGIVKPEFLTVRSHPSHARSAHITPQVEPVTAQANRVNPLDPANRLTTMSADGITFEHTRPKNISDETWNNYKQYSRAQIAHRENPQAFPDSHNNKLLDMKTGQWESQGYSYEQLHTPLGKRPEINANFALTPAQTRPSSTAAKNVFFANKPLLMERMPPIQNVSAFRSQPEVHSVPIASRATVGRTRVR